MKQRLEILASWMKDFNVSIDPYTDGVVESAIKRQKEETIRCIGDLLEEILDMDDEQVKNELK